MATAGLSDLTEIAKLDPFSGDLIVEDSSQANGQLDVATIQSHTVHAAFGGMGSFMLYNEMASPIAAERVHELLSTDAQTNWEGNIK